MVVYHTTLRGTIQTGTLGEIFSHSMGIQSSATEQSVAEAIVAAWKTMWGTDINGLGGYFPSSVTYTEATAAKVIDPAVPDLGAAYHAPFTPPLVGAQGPSSLPSQCAIAISLTAGTRPNGKPFKGRFYLPTPGVAILNTDGTLVPAQTNGICLKFKTYLETLMVAGHYPSIWSRTDEDLVQTVDQVRVGSYIDTIRSRRNKYPEVYNVKTVTGPT